MLLWRVLPPPPQSPIRPWGGKPRPLPARSTGVRLGPKRSDQEPKVQLGGRQLRAFFSTFPPPGISADYVLMPRAHSEPLMKTVNVTNG